jgi:malonyl-CoA decarboxylase
MEIPGAIQPLLAAGRAPTSPAKATTAAFYSISNCQQGLAGVSFGNFLIKQVVEELRREAPGVTTFVTLSPAPGFMEWLRQTAPLLPAQDREIVDGLDDPEWPSDDAFAERARALIEPLAAQYFLEAKGPGGRPLDPVARFHLGNGARLERIDWLGDTSGKGLAESAGVMVNYLYALDLIEANHESYANSGEVVASPAVRRLLKAGPRGRLAHEASAKA